MKLSRLIIENYRNFEKIDLQISNLNVLFGVNDIGKGIYRYIMQTSAKNSNRRGTTAY